jgi:hypothetical protein
MRLQQEVVAVTVSSRVSLAFALGLSVLHPMLGKAAEPLPNSALAPQVAVTDNQKTADLLAARLRQSGQLQHYDVDISCRDGVAELSGTVADVEQRERVLRIARETAGVERVVDRLGVSGAIVPVQAGGPPGTLPPVPPANPVPPAAPAAPGAPGAPGAPMPEAAPIFQAPAPAPYALNPARMPPYSWPTYAPYNNYSRVAYPTAYPYNAWPFIGPIYPFPKIPLGWRAVKLEWDDGFWWYSKTATKYDWWKLRYY